MSDFYRERDRLNGGTDNPWVDAFKDSAQNLDQDGDAEDTFDARKAYGGESVDSNYGL